MSIDTSLMLTTVSPEKVLQGLADWLPEIAGDPATLLVWCARWEPGYTALMFSPQQRSNFTPAEKDPEFQLLPAKELRFAQEFSKAEGEIAWLVGVSHLHRRSWSARFEHGELIRAETTDQGERMDWETPPRRGWLGALLPKKLPEIVRSPWEGAYETAFLEKIQSLLGEGLTQETLLVALEEIEFDQERERALGPRRQVESLQHKGFSQLSALLRDQDPATRQRAIKSLGELPQDQADQVAAALVTCLADPDSSVRQEVLSVLAQLGEDALPAVSAVAIEGEHELEERLLALGLLGTIGGEGALPTLRRALRLTDPDMRATAAQALAKLGPVAAGALPELLASLNESTYSAHYDTGLTLLQLGPLAVPALAEALKADDAFVRRNAAVTLSHVADWGKHTELALQALARALDDGDSLVQQAVATTLHTRAELAQEANIQELALPHVQRALETGDSASRATVAALGGALKLTAATPQLLKILSEADETVAFSVLRALQRLRVGSEALPALRQAFRADGVSLAVRLQVIETLRTAGRAAIPLLEEMIQDGDVRVSSVAQAVLNKARALE